MATKIDPAQILGLIENLSRIGNKSVELQSVINQFVSWSYDGLDLTNYIFQPPALFFRHQNNRRNLL